MNNNLFLGSICLLSLYIYSSYGKIMDIDGTAISLHNKLLPIVNFPMNLCVLAIIGVIILELFGSLFIIYSIYTDKYKEYLYNVVLLFIVFNVVVTMLYHYPNNKKELVNFLKNLSITGGFILLLDRFN
jgi:putative oxidoreductase